MNGLNFSAPPYHNLVAQTVKNLPEMWRPGFNSWVKNILWRRECTDHVADHALIMKLIIH